MSQPHRPRPSANVFLGRSPHQAAVQPKERADRAPHPATLPHGKGAAERAPHPATVQRSAARFGGASAPAPPHPATVIQRSFANAPDAKFQLADINFTEFTSETHHHGTQLNSTFNVPAGLVIFQCPSGFLMDDDAFEVLKKCAKTGTLSGAVALIGASFAAVTLKNEDGDAAWAPVDNSQRGLTAAEIYSMISLPGTTIPDISFTPLEASSDEKKQNATKLSAVVQGKKGTMVCDHCREPLTDPSKRLGKSVFALVLISQLAEAGNDTAAILNTSKAAAAAAFKAWLR